MLCKGRHRKGDHFTIMESEAKGWTICPENQRLAQSTTLLTQAAAPRLCLCACRALEDLPPSAKSWQTVTPSWHTTQT